MKIIVVNTAFLGDVILSLPLCAALRSAYPASTIEFVTTPSAAPIVELCEQVDSVVEFDKRGKHKSLRASKALASSLDSDNDTLVICPHKSIRTAWFVKNIKARNIVTYSDGATRFVATATVPYDTAQHDADRQLSLLQALHPNIGYTKSHPNCSVNFRSNILEELLPSQIRSLKPSPYIVLAPGSAWNTKKWGNHNYFKVAEMCAKLGYRVVVVGSASEAGVTQNEFIVDLCGKTSLPELVSVISQSSVVVANDSAPVHIASLLNTPTIALFGPTIPEFGFAPFSKPSVVIENHHLSCRPCSMHGASKCPINTHECMTSINPTQVVNSICDIFV
jgi:heptosyltransferase II